MRLRLIAAALAAVLSALALTATPALGQGQLIGGRVGRQVYNVNASTGAASGPRTTGGTGGLLGLATAADGTLYGLNSGGASSTGRSAGQLVTIDPATGATVAIGSLGLTSLSEGDLAFDPTTGTLYGVSNEQDQFDRRLFTINTATGASTDLGNITRFGAIVNSSDFSAMAFTADGSLLLLDTFMDRLYTVDKATAEVSAAVDLSTDLGGVAGMVFDRDAGTLYVADGSDAASNLYTLNPTSGTLTLIGPTGVAGGLSGLAFVVPEPTGLAVFGMAGVGLLRRRRRAAC